ELLREGCRVAICSRNSERITGAAEALVDETKASHDDVLPMECDVTVEAHVVRSIDRAAEHFGELNILVTNAGGPPAGYIDDFTAEEWKQALDLNLMSTINMCRAALPHLRAAAGQSAKLARILMITSISAKQPIPNLYLSNTARAGVQGFAKSLAEEVGPKGITVNTILPGYTRTDRLRELAANTSSTSGRSIEEVEAGWAQDNALKRIADPEEFAAAAAFLVSAPASYVTGVAFPVDGGRSKHVL
ncbi:MAG: SDR family oxidoreductase, partial [Rhodothermales bacterium]